MQYYDFTISGNPAKVFGAGKYIAYYAGSAGGGDSTITVRHDLSSTGVILKPGQAYRLPPDKGAATEWTLSPFTAGSAIKGTVVIGDGRIDDARISGSVEVIDGGKARTIAGIAYTGYGFTAAGAGLLSHVQLWNAAGSGKNLIVEQLVISSDLTGSFGVRFHNAALSTILNTVPNKKASGAASAATLRSQTNATALGSASLWGGFSSNTSQALFTPKEPIIVEPGFGLVALNSSPNANLTATFEFYEDPI